MGDAATPTLPDFTSQTASVYKANIDAGFAVADRLALAFAPHEQAAPDMTLRLYAGTIFDGTTLTEVAAQSTGAIAAPSADPRIDRVVIDRTSGAVSVITGVEAAAPTPPAIAADDVPVAQVALTTGTTEITNADITDERVPASAAIGAPNNPLVRPIGAPPVTQGHFLGWLDQNLQFRGDFHSHVSTSGEVGAGSCIFGGTVTPDDVINLSFAFPVTTPSPQVVTYVVQAGDDLQDIADGIQANGVANEVLFGENGAGVWVQPGLANQVTWTGMADDNPTVTNTSTGSGTTTLTITDTNNVLDIGMQRTFQRFVAGRAGVVADHLIGFIFVGQDDSGAARSGVTIIARNKVVTAGSYLGEMWHYTLDYGGTEGNVLEFAYGGGFYIGTAAGATRFGRGTLNVETDIYVGGTLLPVQRMFTSEEQTITAAGSLTIAHGLGKVPAAVGLRIVCKTAEAGYAVGDTLHVNFQSQARTGDEGLSLWADTTDIHIRFATSSNVFFIGHKTTGISSGITVANWKLVVRYLA